MSSHVDRLRPARSAAQEVARGEDLLEPRQRPVRPRLVVAAARRDLRPRRLHRDLQGVEGARLRQPLRAVDQQVDERRAVDHLLELSRELVGVADEIAAGVGRHREEGVGAAPFFGAGSPSARSPPMSTASMTASERENSESAEEMRSARRVLPNRASLSIFQICPDREASPMPAASWCPRPVRPRWTRRAPARVAGAARGAAIRSPPRRTRRACARGPSPARARCRPERSTCFVARPRQELVVGLAAKRLHVAHRVLERLGAELPLRFCSTPASAAPRIREGEDQRIGTRLDEPGDAQGVDGRCELAPVPREVDEQLPARVDRERSDRGQVVLLHRARDEVAGAFAGAHQPGRARVGEVEDQQPEASRGRGNRERSAASRPRAPRA